MAITFVQKTAKAQSAPATTVVTAGLTTTAGNLVVVTHSHWLSGVPNTVVFSDSLGNSWNSVTNQSGTANGENARASIGWCILANAGAGHTFTVTSSDGSSYQQCNASEFTGVHATPLDVTADAETGISSTSTVVTTAALSENDALVVACFSGAAGDAAANISDPCTTGYTSIGVNQDGSATVGYQASYKIVAGGGAQTATWSHDASIDADGTAAVVATFKQAGGGPITDGPKLVATRSNIRLN